MSFFYFDYNILAMKVLLQVVKQASVSIDEKIYSEINKGYLLFVGFNYFDNEEIIKKVMDKVMSLRLFMDNNDKMNLSLNDVNGEVMCVSQFTLYADIKKGRRPSFNLAANGSVSKPLYDYCVEYISSLGYDVKTGVFGADMKIGLINDGPTTIIIDSEDLL